MDFPTYTGAYAVIHRDGALLLTHWIGSPGSGRGAAWTLPGGGIEVGETPEQTVVRELLEETGYRVEVGPILRVENEWTSHGHRIRMLFDATVTGGELGVVEVDGSTDAVRWVPVEDVEGLPHVSMVDSAVALIRTAGSAMG